MLVSRVRPSSLPLCEVNRAVATVQNFDGKPNRMAAFDLAVCDHYPSHEIIPFVRPIAVAISDFHMLVRVVEIKVD